MELTPRVSRLLWGWWLGLHALLAVTAWLVDWPWPIQLAAVLMLSCHGAVRRPRPPPGLIVIGADGGCAVPDLSAGRLVLGPRTVLCPYWVRLDLGMGLERHDIVLCADQLAAEEWARLRAWLERTRHD